MKRHNQGIDSNLGIFIREENRKQTKNDIKQNRKKKCKCEPTHTFLLYYCEKKVQNQILICINQRSRWGVGKSIEENMMASYLTKMECKRRLKRGWEKDEKNLENLNCPTFEASDWGQY